MNRWPHRCFLHQTEQQHWIMGKDTFAQCPTETLAFDHQTLNRISDKWLQRVGIEWRLQSFHPVKCMFYHFIKIKNNNKTVFVCRALCFLSTLQCCVQVMEYQGYVMSRWYCILVILCPDWTSSLQKKIQGMAVHNVFKNSFIPLQAWTLWLYPSVQVMLYPGAAVFRWFCFQMLCLGDVVLRWCCVQMLYLGDAVSRSCA